MITLHRGTIFSFHALEFILAWTRFASEKESIFEVSPIILKHTVLMCRIKALVDKAHSSLNIDEFKKRHRVPSTTGRSKEALQSITLGLVEGSVMVYHRCIIHK